MLNLCEVEALKPYSLYSP